MQEFTLEDVAKFNGQNGEKAYVIYKDKVYDVTDSSMWSEGDHMGMHEAGVDLTEELDTEAPHDASNFDDFPVVGTIKK